MIKKLAWDAFKNTGDINSFLEFKQIENLENNIVENETNIFEAKTIGVNNENEE